MQGAQHQVQSQGAALRKSGREAHALDIDRLFCLSVSKLVAMWGFPVYSKRLSVRWQFCGLQKWYTRWRKFNRLGICLFYPTAFFMADGCQHSKFDASQEMLQGK